MWFSVSVWDNNCHPVSRLATLRPETRTLKQDNCLIFFSIQGNLPHITQNIHSSKEEPESERNQKYFYTVGLLSVPTLALSPTAMRTRHLYSANFKSPFLSFLNHNKQTRSTAVLCVGIMVSVPKQQKRNSSSTAEGKTLPVFRSVNQNWTVSSGCRTLCESIICFAVYYHACRQNVISK